MWWRLYPDADEVVQQARKKMSDQGVNETKKVKVDGEPAVLHITDQSVMFEKGGKVGGFERSAIRMIKPDGDAMVIAYSVGSEVKSTRVEPLTAVTSLLVSSPSSGTMQPPATGWDEVFEKLYRDTRKELEEKLAKVEAEPENMGLRLTLEDEAKYANVSRQMESILSTRYGFDRQDVETTPISFWGLEKQPHQLQLAVVKERHIRFLRMVVGPKAETNDITYSTDEVWPDDWSRILERFGLEGNPYATPAYANYVNYLRQHWKINPGERKPVLARP